jgi:hypothetical protein
MMVPRVFVTSQNLNRRPNRHAAVTRVINPTLNRNCYAAEPAAATNPNLNRNCYVAEPAVETKTKPRLNQASLIF